MDSSIQTLRLQLIKRNDRPSFDYDGVIYLLDTGSQVPVWCSGEKLFKITYPNSEKTALVARLAGFGKGSTKASVYKIPEFALENGDTQYRIKNLHIAVADYNKIPFDFILSSTMFSKADYLVSNKDNILNITFDNAREFECTPLVSKNKIKNISVWAQK